MRGGAAQPDLVRVRPVPDEPELGHVRPCAPIGAPRHPDDEGLLLGEANLGEQGPDALVHRGETPLRLGDRQAAQRQRGARHGLDVQQVRLGVVHVPHRLELLLDLLLPGRVNLAQDEVLLRGEHDAQLVLLDHVPQHLLSLPLEPAIHDEDAIEQLPVPLLPPTKVVLVLPLGERLEGHHLLAKVLLDDVPELVHAPRLHEVLEPALPPVIAPAVVPLRGHNGLDHVVDVVLLDVTEGLRQRGEGGLVVVRPTHPAARQDVVPADLAIVSGHHHNGHVVGEHVNGVVARHGDRDLKLSRQKLSAVDGLGRPLEVGSKSVEVSVLGDLGVLLLGGHELLAIQPHVVVRARLGREEVRNVVRQDLGVLVVHPVLVGVRGGQHVPVHVAAGAKRTSHGLDDGREHALEVILEHAVQLVGLPGCETQSPRPEVRREIIHREVELVRHEPARLPRSEHELVRLSPAKPPGLPVVLHIRTVELDELHGVVAHVRLSVHEILQKRMPQIVRPLLNKLHLAPGGHVGGWGPGRHGDVRSHPTALPPGRKPARGA
mmetsp:Transcript_3220/g.11215  ORF Transcript_3220/g.11215 Transcript_3220/m.11215 type:complete len:547 (-) Transcript_3220:141-1781(-)